MRFDDAYANSRYIPGGDTYAARWAREAADFRASARARLDQTFPGGRYDLFLPETDPHGTLVFVHGGYWMAFGPRDFSHLAAGALARGWACAMPFYTLAPAARIAAITRQIAAAVEAVAASVPGPLVVTGHSAGGHLAARLGNADLAPEAGRGRVGRVVPISPLSDLRPLRETTMNATLGLDAAEARDESPALVPRNPAVAAHVWVGGRERPAFLDQARRLGNAWSCPVTVEPERHHFDVVEGLARAASPLMTAVLGQP